MNLMRDDALVRACIDGDGRAWNQILDRYGPLVYTIALRCGLRASDAEDVYQNVWILLLENLERLREPAALRGWLAMTTQREAWRHDRRRRAALGAEMPGDDFDPPAGDDPEAETLALADRSLVDQGMRKVPARCRTLLTLLYFTEPAPEYREVAAHLDMPVGSVGPTRARCLEALKKILVAIGF